MTKVESTTELISEADYRSALVDIRAYFEAEPECGTPEAQRFDALAALIEQYEARHYPL